MQFRSIRRLYCLLLATIVALCTTTVDSQRQLAQAATENTDKTAISGVTAAVEGPESQTQAFIYQYLLGDMAWRRGDLKLASEAMAQAAKISGDKETILRAYGLGLEAGRPAIAVEMAEQMLKLKTDTVRAQAMLLRAHIAGNRPDDVYRDLVTLLEQSGDDMDVVVRYVGEVLGSVPDADRWLGVMQRIADRLPDSLKCISPAALSRIAQVSLVKPIFHLIGRWNCGPAGKKQRFSGCPGGTMPKSGKPSRHLLKNSLPPIQTGVVFNWSLHVCWCNGRITPRRSSSFGTW